MELSIVGNSIQIKSKYEERQQCKDIGAWWNAEKKVWYIVIAKLKPEHLEKMVEYGFQNIVDKIIDEQARPEIERQKAIYEAKRKATEELEQQRLKKKYDIPEHPTLKIGLKKLKINLLDYQKEDVNFGLHRLQKHNSFCIFSGLGSGKTLQAMTIALTVNIKCLVVSPAFLKKNWDKEIQKFCDESYFVVRTKKDLVKTKEIEEAKFVIINYEILEACEHLFVNRLVIADEAVALKNREAKRTQFFFEYIKHAIRVIFMTGTPLKSGVPDSFTIFSYCSPIYPQNYWEYCKRYAIETQKKVMGREVTVFVGFNKDNKEEFLAAQDAFSVRRRTKDVVRLPEMMHITQWVEAEPLSKYCDIELGDQKSLLDFIKNGGLSALEKEMKEKMSKWKRANALSKAKACAQYALSIIEDENPKLIIFSDHPDACKIIADELGKELNVAVIIGSTDMQKRSEYQNDFQNGNLNVIVATIGAMSTGVTLTAANITIFNDQNWSPDQNEQASARIYRIGQERDCTTVYLVASELDEIINKVITRKNYAIKNALKNY